MFTVDLTKLPPSMNNMAGCALKMISAAVGYNMTCSSQAKVENRLPKGATVQQKPLQNRLVSDVQPRDIKPFEVETPPSISSSKKRNNHKKGSPSGKQAEPVTTFSNNKPCTSTTRVQTRSMPAFEKPNPNALSPRTIRRKIKEGQARKKSWHPSEILRRRWTKMSSKEQEELVQQFESFLASGATQARDWLIWNVPKYGVSMIYLILSGEIPGYAEDAGSV